MTGIITQNSDISICAEALLSLGAQPIADFDENNDSARACANIYATARDDLLRRHYWNCCIKRQIGSPDTQPPAWGYAKRFPVPSDLITLLGVVVIPEASQPGMPAMAPAYTQDYTMEGRAVLANYNSIGFHYVYRNSNVATWDSGLIRMMILRMRWALAYTITKDLTVEAAAAQTFAAELKSYKTADGMETPPWELIGDSLMEARYGS